MNTYNLQRDFMAKLPSIFSTSFLTLAFVTGYPLPALPQQHTHTLQDTADFSSFRVHFDLNTCSKSDYSITLNSVRQIVGNDGLTTSGLFPVFGENKIHVSTSCPAAEAVYLQGSSEGDSHNVIKMIPEEEYEFSATPNLSPLGEEASSTAHSILSSHLEGNLPGDIFSSITREASTSDSQMFYYMARPSRGTAFYDDFSIEETQIYSIEAPSNGPGLYLLADLTETSLQHFDAVLLAEVSGRLLPWARIGLSDAVKIDQIPPKWRQ